MGRSGTPTPSSIIQTLFFFLFFCFYFFSKADWKVTVFLPVHLNCVLSGSACCPVWWHLRGSWLCSGLGRAKTGKLLPTLMLQQAGVTNCKREGEAAVTLSLGQAAAMSWSLSSNLPPGLVPSQPPWGQCPCITHLCCNECARQDQGNAVNAEGWASRTAAGRPTAQPSQGLILWSNSCRQSSVVRYPKVNTAQLFCELLILPETLRDVCWSDLDAVQIGGHLCFSYSVFVSWQVVFSPFPMQRTVQSLF